MESRPGKVDSAALVQAAALPRAGQGNAIMLAKPGPVFPQRLVFHRRLWAGCAVLALVLGACNGGGDVPAPGAESAAAGSPPAASGASAAAGEQAAAGSPEAAGQPAPIDPAVAFPNLPRLEGKATVIVTVNGAPITMELDGEKAPITAGNFVDLAQKGVYDGTVFHRVVRDPQPFVVQGGDPQGKDPNVPLESLGMGSYVDESGEPRYIPLEILPQGADLPIYGQPFVASGITEPPVLQHKRGAVAMARSRFPDTASAQFYITLDNVNFLDGDYAVFGQVTDGMDVVDGIEQGDVIDSVEVIEGAENLKP